MTEYSEAQWNDLIDQYQDGTISESDRFALEKKALDDPFLFDALEGYALYNDEKSTPKSEDSKVFTLPRLAAAASLIFLVSMIFLMKTDDVAESSVNEKIAMTIPEKEIAPTNENDISSETSEEDESQESTATTPVTNIDNNAKKRKEDTTQAKSKTVKNNTNTNSKIDKTLAKQESIIENGSLPDEEFAEQEIVSTEVSKVNTSQIEETPSTPSARIDKTKEDVIVVNADSKEFIQTDTDDVADISISSEMGAMTKTKKKEAPVLFYVAEPMIGKADFDEYVQQRINQRSDLKQNPSQEIIIEFSIDKNGEIGNFVHIVDNGECSTCGSFAINILQNSGVWRTVPAGNTGRARYMFTF